MSCFSLINPESAEVTQSCVLPHPATDTTPDTGSTMTSFECRDGFTLSEDEHCCQGELFASYAMECLSYLIINECLKDVGTDCLNTQGSFVCTCYDDFQLSEDQMHCDGGWSYRES